MSMEDGQAKQPLRPITETTQGREKIHKQRKETARNKLKKRINNIIIVEVNNNNNNNTKGRKRRRKNRVPAELIG